MYCFPADFHFLPHTQNFFYIYVYTYTFTHGMLHLPVRLKSYLKLFTIAGKSTIVKMLLRLYDPTSGSVICNGESIKGLKVVSLREHIGIVDQHPSLLIGSLRDNIGYGKVSSQSDPTDEEIKTAASVAAADSFISSFSGGYDTQVGAGGSKISGGQRQRIAIARAVIRDPKLLILDEATAALDTENERHVADALGRLMVGRTTIVIAHR